MKKVRYFFEYILVKIWLWFVEMLPLEVASNLGAKLFQIIGMKLKVTRIARNNLKKTFPDYTAKKIEEIIYGVWDNFGRVAAETSILMKMPQVQFDKYIKIKGVENLAKYKDKPVLLCASHQANWEFIAKALVPYNIKVGGVFRKANNHLVNKIIDDIRHLVDVNMIPKGRAGAKELLNAIKNNEQIVMLVDQKMNDGIKIPFLGRDAMTAPAIANLALKYNCPIIPLQAIRIKNSNFELIIHPELEIENKSTHEIMLNINEQIGNWVKERPEQWFWLHRRWID